MASLRSNDKQLSLPSPIPYPMSNAFFRVPTPINEPVKGYAPGAPERIELVKELKRIKQVERDIPMHIGGQEVRTGRTLPLSPPHDHKHVLAHFHEGDASHVTQAIDAALAARTAWAGLPWEERAAIFLKAAELLAGPYRARINAATMLGQSKNAFQAEIDAACELIDFLRFNVYFAQEIYRQQPESSPGMWNRLEHRPLEGFVFALTRSTSRPLPLTCRFRPRSWATWWCGSPPTPKFIRRRC